MQCQSCHKELAEGAKFCKFCGAKQKVSFSATPNYEEKQEIFPPQAEALWREAQNSSQVPPTAFTSQKKAEEKAAFEEKPRQGQPATPKKVVPKGKGRRWLPLVTGGAVMIVIIAVALAIVLEKLDKRAGMQPDGESGIKEETASDEFSGSFLPETELLDGEPVEEPGTATATFCIACGENIPENALFCPYCGERQATVDEKEEGEITTVSLGSESDIDSSRFFVLPIQSTDQSSVVVQSGNHDNTALATVDGKLETSWQEGADGDGTGEWVRYNLGSTRTVQYLRLHLGNWRGSNWYSENNVPKELEIEINGQTWQLEFPYGQEPCVVAWSAPVETDYVVLRIASVYEGSVYDDTCIAEVQIIGH